MTDLRKAAEAVLEAWDWDWSEPRNEALRERMEALRQALAMEKFSKVNQEIEEALKQPEQEPVAWVYNGILHEFDPSEFATSEVTPLYIAPPKRKWVGLTDEEVESWRGNYDFFDSALVREVEAKLKEKNT